VAGATKIVCTGEIIQTEQACDLSLSREAYFRILRMKTAELFALSCDLGARLSGANLDDQQALRDYGMALGTAYQIYDDCVDLFGTESKAGKSLGTDLLGGKVTLPLIVALERVGDARRPQVEALLRGWQAENRVELLALLRETGALEEAARVTHGFCEDARRALGALTPTAGRRALLAATDFLAQQTEALRSNAAG
jgi:octaprenyl-diphosphate synthase